MSDTIADLTMDELTTIIEHIVDARIAQPLKPWYSIPIPKDPEVYLEELRTGILPTPDDVPTPSEMVVEERERWRSGSS
jgi:hypothetical protein